MAQRSTPAKSDDLRDGNRKRVLDAVRRNALISRTELGNQTGLSPATVSAITSDFLDEGVLRLPSLAEPKPLGRGRPTVALELCDDAALVCAVYFKLNFVAAQLFDFRGQSVAEYSNTIDTSDISSKAMKSTIISAIENVVTGASGDQRALSRIAVGFQGVTDVEGHTVLWTPLCQGQNLPIQKWLEDHFNVPTHVANDCDMAAAALNWRAPEKYGTNFAAVLLAHGVGMGLFLDDSIVNGTRSSGIEFGHMTYVPDGSQCLCGNRGCIEAYAGDYAIIRHALGLEHDHLPDMLTEAGQLQAIGEAARNGDVSALEAIKSAGSAIGTGLASLFALLDPFPIVLVGSGAALFDLMEPSMRKALQAAPNQNQTAPVTIDCVIDEIELVLEGCAISALVRQDQIFAKRQPIQQVGV